MALVESYRSHRTSLTPEDALIDRHAGQDYGRSLGAHRAPRIYGLHPGSVLYSMDYLPGSRPLSASFNASLASKASIGSNMSASGTSMSSRRSSMLAPQKPRPALPPRSASKKLPFDVYECILRQLRIVHFTTSTRSCSTCYMRDLCSLALTSRLWNRAVRPQLYGRIHIEGHESTSQLKKYKIKSGARLKLLRRTLRERPALAQYVHELKVPNLQSGSEDFSPEFINMVASIVMACPNLEKLLGFYPTYRHEFDRLTHALSTRTKLKEHVWIIGENDAITQRSRIQLPPGLMDNQQATSFLAYHASWSSLSTLILDSQPNAILEHNVFVSLFSLLPFLQHLHISSFDADDFNDRTLARIPPALRSLRLQSLPGITPAGLSRLVSSESAATLTSLSLISLHIPHISTIAKLFAHLPLRRFTLHQSNAPVLPPHEPVLVPVLASSSLCHLHWQASSHPLDDTANMFLASSIRAHGFPALRSLRAPTDPHGLLQNLCKPVAQITLPADKYSSLPSKLPPDAYKRTLHASRTTAQARLDQAREKVGFQVVVSEEGRAGAVYDFRGFVGTIGSLIGYELTPDVPGSDEALAQVADLKGKEEGRCKGGEGGGKKGGHVERGRWREVPVRRLF